MDKLQGFLDWLSRLDADTQTVVLRCIAVAVGLLVIALAVCIAKMFGGGKPVQPRRRELENMRHAALIVHELGYSSEELEMLLKVARLEEEQQARRGAEPRVDRRGPLGGKVSGEALR